MAASTIISGITKEIKLDRITKNYQCSISIDGGPFESIGRTDTYGEGEALCTRFAYDYLSDNHTPELAAELLLPTAAQLGQRLCAARAVVMDADTRTEAERRYDAERDGTAYVKPVDPLVALRAQIDAETDQSTRHRLIFRMADQILGIGDKAPTTGDELPFGQLHDGTPILGTYDAGEPNGRSGLVHASVNGMQLSAQDDPSLFSMGGSLDDMTLDQLNAIRAILNTDIPEQMLAAAIAHRRGDAPPTPPATPTRAVQADYLYPDPNDDESYITQPNGALAFVDFKYGAAQLSVNASGRIDYLALGRASVCQIKDLQMLPDLETILADPRVKALRRGHTPPAVRTVGWYRDPDQGGDLVAQPVGPLAWVDYICGEGDTRACISFDVEGHSDPHVALSGQADFTIDEMERSIPHMLAVLNDPRVQAARVRSEAGAPLKKAA